MDWKSKLTADPTDWLLECDNPSVRYFTLIDILGKALDAPEVIKSKRDIMESGAVPRILARQEEGGYWGVPENFYVRAKYKGTVWQFIILAELGADGQDERIHKTCEFILDRSQDRESGGFAYRSGKDGGGNHDGIIPCLTGNMVWSLIRFGYLNDTRLQRGIDWITRYQRFDDGQPGVPKSWPYARRDNCWGRHTCHMGVAKALKALAEIPPEQRSSDVVGTIEQGAEYLLKHHIFKRSHDPDQIANPRWQWFGFPLIWRMDILEVLWVLLRLGYRDERMQDALELVASKQDMQGRWFMDDTFNGRFLVNIEQKGKPSKWVTLNALRVLQAASVGLKT